MEYDHELLQERVAESFKSMAVMEWLKDNIKREVLPFASDGTSEEGTPEKEEGDHPGKEAQGAGGARG